VYHILVLDVPYVAQENAWSCGYVCFMMLRLLSYASVSAVMAEFELSWALGSDPVAAAQLSPLKDKEGKALHTGADDYCGLLRHKRVPCDVFTFKDGLGLLAFCRDYFAKGGALGGEGAVLAATVGALFLQRDGHCYVAIGVRYCPADNDVAIICFDSRTPESPVTLIDKERVGREVAGREKTSWQVLVVYEGYELSEEEGRRLSRNVKLTCNKTG